MANVLFVSTLTANADFATDVSSVLEFIRQDLVSFVPLDERDGDPRRDVFGPNDTVESAATVEQDASIVTNGAPNSAHFSGAGAFLKRVSPVGLNLGAGSFTVSFWARIDGALSSNKGGVSKFNPTGGQRQFSVLFAGSGSQTWSFRVSGDGSDEFSVDDDDVISATGEKHFVLAWYDGATDTINIQVDNGAVLSAAGPASVHAGTADLEIGNFISSVFDGLIQDVAIWARVLNADERAGLYHSGDGIWLESYIPRDLSTFTEMWKFNEGGSGTLTSVNGLGDLTQVGTVPSKTGHVEDPASSFLARGDYSPIGSPGPDNYHARAHVASDIFDLTAGKVSCTFAGWFLIPSAAIASNPFGFTIHGERLNPGGANGQAIQIHLNNATGAAKNPRFHMLDGVTPFAGAAVSATTTAVAVPADTFQLVVGGYDAERDKVFCFWGRSVDEFFYSEADAVAAGFGYTGSGTEIAFGEFQFPGTFNNTERWDQSLWFKGRALRLPSILALWNNHVGTPESALDFTDVLLSSSFTADADFNALLLVPNTLACSLTVDADFVAELSGVEYASNVTVDADFSASLLVAPSFAVDFAADADFASLLLHTKALKCDWMADADFSALLLVPNNLACSLTVDADFNAELSAVSFACGVTVDADFATLLLVPNTLACSLTVDADFVTFLLVPETLDARSKFDADFVADLLVINHNAYVNDLLGITDQLTAGLQVSGLSSNLKPSVLDTQYQIEKLADGTTLAFLGVVPVIAEPTGAVAAALPATVHNAYFDTHLGPGQDWFEGLFVIPASVALGFVVSDQSVPLQIYSSFKTATRFLNSTVNNVDSGFSFGGGFPSLPKTILPQSGFSFTVEVDNDGPPLIIGTIDFVFDIQTIKVPFTGQRTQLFSVPPVLPLRERLRFSTDVMRRRDEEEQRVAKRLTPRQLLNYAFEVEGFDRQCLEALIFDAQGRVLGLPIWFEPIQITQAITAGDLFINVADTAFRDLRVGGLACVFQSPKVFDVAEVAFVTTNTVTFTTALVLSHPTSALLYPVRIGFMEGVIRSSKAPVRMQTTRIQFRVQDNDSELSSTAAFPTFDGKVLLDGPNLISGELTENWERRLHVVDSRTGTFEVTADAQVSRRGHQKKFLSRSRQSLWEVRQLLHALRGRQVSFYIPSFYDEFILTTPVGAADDTITFENFGYTRFIQERVPRAAIQLVLNDGTKLPRKVIDAVELSTTEERIQVDAAWGVAATLDEIDRVEYLTKVRMDSDDVSIEHLDALGQAIISFPVKAVVE